MGQANTLHIIEFSFGNSSPVRIEYPSRSLAEEACARLKSRVQNIRSIRVLGEPKSLFRSDNLRPPRRFSQNTEQGAI